MVKFLKIGKNEAQKAQDEEQVREIVKQCYEETLNLVANNRSAMDKLVEILIEKEKYLK